MQALISTFILATALAAQAALPKVPVFYSTDLFHPHEDPDDHFDLATLFAMPEFEIKGIILEQGKRQVKNPGEIPLRQMMQITGREVPFALGLSDKLSSPADDGKTQPAEFQGGVKLMEKVLKESSQRVTIITAGSVRDVCALWNRAPELMKEKVGRLYINIGNADPAGTEYNVDLDVNAYVGLLRSSLPIYLCYCMPMQRPHSNAVYSTYWRFRQGPVLEQAPKPLQNFFIYALQRPSPDELDPGQALSADLRAWHRLVWGMERNMWCTASFIHAAAPSSTARWRSIVTTKAPSFRFMPARIEVDEAGKTKTFIDSRNPKVQVFKVLDPPRYEKDMRQFLGDLLRDIQVRQ